MNRVNVGPRGGLHKLPRIGVERFEVAALAFVENDVERKRGFTRTRRPRDDGEAFRRNLDADVFQIVFARVQDADRTRLRARQVGAQSRD